jgi:hypothetical protein
MSLIDVLKTVDYRYARGKRHPLWVLLVLIVIGNLAGYWGNRPLEEFSRRYGATLARLLHLETLPTPSFSTFRRVHQHLDFTALSDGFSQWMHAHMAVDEDLYAIDGKRIAQGIAREEGKTRYVGLVSVFAQHQGITAAVVALSVTDNSEIKVVQYLLEKLHLKRAIFSLDALHTHKNTGADSGQWQ